MGTERFDYYLYTQNKDKIRKKLISGNIDYGSLSEMKFVDKFFAFVFASGFFDFAEATYPSPRAKKEVPPWFLLASVMAAKICGEESFLNIPHVLKNGTILKMLGLNLGTISGFNKKNKKERIYPCSQDTVRKFFKDTDPSGLTLWLNRKFSSWMGGMGAYKRGLYIEDASFIPLPGNPNYQNSDYIWLDEEGNHAEAGSPGARSVQCYKLTSLLNTNREASYYVYAGARIDPGSVNGLDEGKDLVEGFLKNGGYIDTLLLDRGYIDGPTLSHYKRDFKINWVIPLRSNMAAYDDAVGLCRRKDVKWTDYKTETDDSGFISKKEEVTSFFDIGTWENLTVPLHISVKRQTDYVKGKVTYFVLAHSKKYKYPAEAFDLYKVRTAIEERHRQLKCFWDLTKFPSPSYSLVVTQIVFKLICYSLMQLYLYRSDMGSLARKTISTITKKEMAGECVVILYSGSSYGVFDLDEYSLILMNLEEDCKKRLTGKIRTWNKSPP